jgi:DNA transposition AAA+ family ATPase
MKIRQVITPQGRAALAEVEQMRSCGASWDRRLGLIWGPAGSGKATVAHLICQAYSEAKLVRLDALMTTRSMLQAIFQAICGWHLDVHDMRALFERVIEELQERRTILLLDEGDNLLRGDRFNMLDVVRDIADKSGALIVMFSVKKLAARLRAGAYHSETFSSRMFFQMEFQRPSLDDVILIVKELIEGVALDRDLIEFLWQKAGGSYRPLMVMLADIERVAHETETRRLNLPKWRELTTLGAPIESVAKASAVKPLRAAG